VTTVTLDGLVARLQEAHGPALRTVAVYGSAAAGEHVARHSDINVLVLVETLPLTALRGMAAPTRAWVEAGNPPPLTMTVAEWRASSDIFPMEYADILERHRLLHGTLPTEGVAVTPRDLRLQVEQEAMGKLLRLRSHVMAAGDDPARQGALLAQSLSTIMAILRGVVRLHGEAPEREYPALAAHVERMTGGAVPAAPFQAAVGHRRGDAPIADAGLPAAVAGYLDAMERLVRYLDGYGTT
jgi:hypothetical protein